MKTFFPMLFIIFFLSLLSVAAQLPTAAVGDLVLDKGVAPHKGLDDVYRRFSEGYRKLDAASVAGLYTETAAYLAPGSDIQIGRGSILENFTGFFNAVKRQNGRIEIAFRIFQRQTDKNLAYDVGVYTLKSTNAKGETRADSGKFVVVAVREKDDLWRFQVDGYSDLPKPKAQSNLQNRTQGDVSVFVDGL